MKRLIIALFLALSLAAQAQNFPSSFKVDQDVFSFGSDFTLSNGLGTVKERILSMTSSFSYYSKSGSKIASATESMFSFGTEITVYDAQNRTIGYIKEEVFDSWFSFYAIYSIRDSKGNKLATSRKLDFFSTTIDFYDNSNNLIVQMVRPAINFFSDEWTVNIIVQGRIDNRILVFIPCYKTTADEHKKHKDDK